MRDTWEEESCEPERLMTAGIRIVAFVNARVAIKHETDFPEGRIGDLYTFRNGRVTEFITVVDRQNAIDWT